MSKVSFIAPSQTEPTAALRQPHTWLISYVAGKTRGLAAGLLAACILCLPSPSPAQIKTGNRGGVRLLPAPGAPAAPLGVTQDLTAPVWATADHPLFHSIYTGDEGSVVATSKYGDISSNDLYLWLILKKSPTPHILQQFERVRAMGDKKRLATLLRTEIDEYIFTNYVIPELMGNAPCDANSGFREYLHLLPAYQLTYILRLIKPQVCIQEADRLKYLLEHKALFKTGERYRARYIRLKSTFGEPIEDQDRVEARIVDLRQQLAQKDLTFEAAARKHSQAPSAQNGGELPPFRKGELFFFFEDALANLQPGEVSQPFRGPDGSFYLVQLLEVLPEQAPSLSDPEIARRVDEGVWPKALGAHYRYDHRTLFEENRPIMMTSDWDSRADCDMVGCIGDFAVTKAQLRNAFPEIEGEDLQRKTSMINMTLKPLLEREAMAQAVRDGGCDNDPILKRARWMAANLTRRDAFAESCEAGLKINDSIVKAFWSKRSDLFTPMTMKRIFKVSLTPTGDGPGPAGVAGELARIVTVAASGQNPTALPPVVAAGPESAVDQILSAGGAEALSLFVPILPETTGSTELEPVPLEPDVSPIITTGSVENMDTPESAVPRVVMAATTSTVAAVSSTETINLKSGEKTPRGGAAPETVGGGLVKTSNEAPLSAVPTRKIASASPPPAPSVKAPAVAGIGETPEEFSARVADTPPNQAVENPACPPEYIPPVYGNRLEDFLPETPPAVPCPAAIPFNPDLWFAKLSSRDMMDLFASYVSAEFALKVEDLGYLYAADRPELARFIKDLTPGSFSYPVASAGGAVSYFVANAKRPQKPAFEEIKSRVYSAYRLIEVNQCLGQTKNSAIKKARVVYSFEKGQLPE